MNHRVISILIGVMIIAAVVGGVVYWEFPVPPGKLRESSAPSTETRVSNSPVGVFRMATTSAAMESDVSSKNEGNRPSRPGYSSQIIHVKFREGTSVDPPEVLLPPNLRTSVAHITRLSTLSEQELTKLGAGRFKLWFKITLEPGVDAGAFMEALKHLDSVELVEPASLPAPPPS